MTKCYVAANKIEKEKIALKKKKKKNSGLRIYFYTNFLG